MNFTLVSAKDSSAPMDESSFTKSVLPLNGKVFHFKLIDTSASPYIVRMFTDSACRNEILPSASAINSQICDGDAISGSVSWVNSSTDFYFQSLCHHTNLAAIYNELSMTAVDSLAVPESIEANQLYAARFNDDGHFYRAKIIHIGGAAADYTVLFIDYGNQAKSTDIRLLPDRLQAILPCATKYSLVLPAAQSHTLMSENDFKKMARSLKRCYLKVVDTAENRPNLVRLFRDAGCREEIQVDVENIVIASIVWCRTSQDFFVHTIEQQNRLRIISEDLKLSAKRSILKWLENGALCATLFEGEFYRAKLLGENDEGIEITI